VREAEGCYKLRLICFDMFDIAGHDQTSLVALRILDRLVERECPRLSSIPR
jgi:hypothetical protein